MEMFQRIAIRELIAKGEAALKTGPFGTQLKASEYTENGTPVINVRNIGLGNIRSDKLEFISPETRDRLSSHILRKNDIVFGRKGAVERHVFIRQEQDGWFQGSDCLRLRLLSHRVDPQFVSYFLFTSEHQQWMMNQCSHGATMASLNQDIIERIELPLPLLTIQRKITAILSAYDDLIENNLRRIKILEEMAQNLYREWFVKFRFPGYENAKMANDLPEGWEKVTLRDVTNYINRGISPNYAENTDRQVINQKCIRDNKLNLELARQHATQYGVDKAVRFGDVLVNSTGVGTLGRVAQVYDELTNYTVDSHVTIVRPNNTVQVDYFGLYLFGLQPYFDQMGVGATGQTELSRERIANAQFVLPPLALQEQFGYSVSPQRKLILNLQRRNQKLMETRDLLLPRLISGEVDVSGLDIAVPAEARA